MIGDRFDQVKWSLIPMATALGQSECDPRNYGES